MFDEHAIDFGSYLAVWEHNALSNINQTRLELSGDEWVWLHVLDFAVVHVDRRYSLLRRYIHTLVGCSSRFVGGWWRI